MPLYRRPGSHVPHKSLSQARATSMPGAAWAVSRCLPDLSRVNDSSRFRRHPYAFDTQSVVCSRSPSWLSPDALVVHLFQRRSPPRLLTGAARGGLKPPPAGRLRRTYLHLSCSTASSGSIYYMNPPLAFVPHHRRRTAPTCRGPASTRLCPRRADRYWRAAARSPRPAVSP